MPVIGLIEPHRYRGRARSYTGSGMTRYSAEGAIWKARMISGGGFYASVRTMLSADYFPPRLML